MDTDELKDWSKRLMTFGVIGVLLVTLAATVMDGSGEQVEAQDAEHAGGLQTTQRDCEFVELEAQIYFRCADGFEGKVMPLDPTAPTSEPTPIP